MDKDIINQFESVVVQHISFTDMLKKLHLELIDANNAYDENKDIANQIQLFAVQQKICKYFTYANTSNVFRNLDALHSIIANYEI